MMATKPVFLKLAKHLTEDVGTQFPETKELYEIMHNKVWA